MTQRNTRSASRHAGTSAGSTGGAPVTSAGSTGGTPVTSAGSTRGTPVTSAGSTGGAPVTSVGSTGGTPVTSAGSTGGTPVTSAGSIGGTPVTSAGYTGGTPVTSAGSTGGTPVTSAGSTGGTPVTSAGSTVGTSVTSAGSTGAAQVSLTRSTGATGGSERGYMETFRGGAAESTKDKEKTQVTQPNSESTIVGSDRFWVYVHIIIYSVAALVIAILVHRLYLTGNSGPGGNEGKEDEKYLVSKFEGFRKELSSMKQKQDEAKKRYHDTLEEHKQETKQHNEETFRNVDGRLSAITITVSTKADLDELNKKSSELIGKLNAVQDGFTKELEKMKKTFTKQSQEFTELIKENEKEFNKTQGTLRELEEKTKGEMESFRSSLSVINTKIEVDLKNMLDNVDKQLTAITIAKEKADKILNRLETDVNRIFPNTFNKEALTGAFLVLTVIVFLLAFWIYRVQASVAPGGRTHQHRYAANVRQENPARAPPSNSICIVSFDEARRSVHEALVTSSLLNVRDARMNYYVVRRHEHLHQLPRCPVYIMCIEFSERHVIIEEPGLGLGDLKKCTYEAIQRYDAPMIIIYTRDPGSRTLGDELYNRRIHCVDKQPELSTLRDRDRFFSTYDQLTDRQKRLLKDTISDCIR